MTKTYSEARQAVYFRAAAAMYDVATGILDDCTEPAEFVGRTYEWSRDIAASTAKRAQALKDLGLEEASVYDRRVVSGYNRAQQRYSKAVDRHLALRKQYFGAAPATTTYV